jgi:hypothetical protein
MPTAFLTVVVTITGLKHDMDGILLDLVLRADRDVQ